MTRTTACHRCAAPARLALSTTDINRRLSEETFDYFHCSNCGLFFLDPIPDDLGRYYKGGYQPIPASLDELRRMAAPDKSRLDPILRYHRGGDLLEIGPWIGLFSINARDAGFKVDAIDMSAEAVAFLRTVADIDAVRSADAAAILAARDKSYDVIVFWHSMEHLPRPWQVLAAAARRLKPGGVLLIAIPNIASDQMRRMGARWLHIDAPRHLYFWSPDALVAMGRDLGLDLAELTTDDPLSRALESGAEMTRIRQLVRVPILRGVAAHLGAPLMRSLHPTPSDGKSGAGITAVFRARATAEVASQPL